jgi:hypothetical protein
MGVGWYTAQPSPNWPLEFAPQAQTVPSPFTAKPWLTPAVAATTPVNPPT